MIGKKLLIAGVLLTLLIGLSFAQALRPAQDRPQPAAAQDGIEFYFSPEGGAAEAVIHEINQAREQVLVAAYYFTSAPIARALLDTHRRGVDVRILLDQRQRTAQYSSSTFFVNQGLPTYLARGYAMPRRCNSRLRNGRRRMACA